MHVFNPRDKLKSSKVNENFQNIVNGDEMHYNAGWTDYGVDFATLGSSGKPTIGNGTLNGRYFRLGRLCFVRIFCRFGSTSTYDGTGGNWCFTLPLPASRDNYNSTNGGGGYQVGEAYIEDNSSVAYFGSVVLLREINVVRLFCWVTSGSFMTISGVNFNTPFTFANTDFISMSFMYELEDNMI